MRGFYSGRKVGVYGALTVISLQERRSPLTALYTWRMILQKNVWVLCWTCIENK